MEFTNLERVITANIETIISEYRNKLNTLGINSTRNLYNNITFNVVKLGDRYEGSINLEDYFKIIEEGRRVGAKQPPISSVVKWMRQKPIQLQPGRNGKLPTENQAAFLIARSIKREGIKGKHLLEKSLPPDDISLTVKMNNAIYLDIENYYKTVLKNESRIFT